MYSFIDAGFKVFSVLVELMKELADPAFFWRRRLSALCYMIRAHVLSSCSANFLLRLI
jgi:hypothetical protein